MRCGERSRIDENFNEVAVAVEVIFVVGFIAYNL